MNININININIYIGNRASLSCIKLHLLVFVYYAFTLILHLNLIWAISTNGGKHYYHGIGLFATKSQTDLEASCDYGRH